MLRFFYRILLSIVWIMHKVGLCIMGATDCQGMLKVIQHALTIADFLSDHPARLGIAIKLTSIGEGDYHVVKKRALCCSRSVCFYVLPRASKN
jgi:hypothetical protein